MDLDIVNNNYILRPSIAEMIRELDVKLDNDLWHSVEMIVSSSPKVTDNTDDTNNQVDTLAVQSDLECSNKQMQDIQVDENVAVLLL
jgi:hypothetical protein